MKFLIHHWIKKPRKVVGVIFLLILLLMAAWAEPVWERLLGLEFKRPSYFLRPEEKGPPPQIEIVGGLEEPQEVWTPKSPNEISLSDGRAFASGMRGSGYSLPRDFLLFRDAAGLVVRTEEEGWFRLETIPLRMRSIPAIVIRSEGPEEIKEDPIAPRFRGLDSHEVAANWRRSLREIRPTDHRPLALGMRGGDPFQMVTLRNPLEKISDHHFRSSEVVLRGGDVDGAKGVKGEVNTAEIIARGEGWRFDDSGQQTPETDKTLAQVNRESDGDKSPLEKPSLVIALNPEDEPTRPEFPDAQKLRSEDRRFVPIRSESVLIVRDDGGRIYAPGFKLAMFDVRVNLNATTVYNDNVFLNSKSTPKKKDIITSVAPDFEMATGDTNRGVTDVLYAAFRYTPTILAFLSQTKESTLNQSAVFKGGYQFSRLSLIFEQQVKDVSGGDIERADFLNRKIYETTGSAEYDLTERTNVEVAGNLLTRNLEEGFNSNDLRVRGYLNHELYAKLRVGGGLALGTTQSKGTSEQYYEQLLARAVYVASEKTNLFGELGFETRQFVDGTPQASNGVFRAGGNYQIFPKTDISINTARRQSASNAFFGQNVMLTSLGGAVSQSIQRATLSLSYSFDHAEYVAAASGVDASRTDQFSTFALGGTYGVLDWMDIGAFYNRRVNDSNFSIFEFEGNQFGMSTQIRF